MAINEGSNSLPVVTTTTAATLTEPTACSRFCGYIISTPGKVKSFFQSAPDVAKSYIQSAWKNLAVTPFSAACKGVKIANDALWFGIGAVREGVITTSQYFKSGAYGAAFGCLGGMLTGAATGALLGYGLGSVGSPIVGITTGGFCALIGAGIGAMTCATGGSLAASFCQYRDSWKNAMNAKNDEINRLKAELDKHSESPKVGKKPPSESTTS